MVDTETQTKALVTKRNGEEVAFDANKIVNAISKANAEVLDSERLTNDEIGNIANKIAMYAGSLGHSISVEDIQNLVETEIMKCGRYEVAKKYIRYRYAHELRRKKNTTDDKILSLISNTNEELNYENSNKNPKIISTLRDYLAGVTCTDITERHFLTEDVRKAHEEGRIHVHDKDYFAEPTYNCMLINLEDMLQNGTVISKTLIEKPHRFLTACTIATQIVAQCSSNIYGGQTISLSHLAPFVEESRKKIRQDLNSEMAEVGRVLTHEEKEKVVEKRTRQEIKTGVQVLQYQINTLLTSNG